LLNNINSQTNLKCVDFKNEELKMLFFIDTKVKNESRLNLRKASGGGGRYYIKLGNHWLSWAMRSLPFTAYEVLLPYLQQSAAGAHPINAPHTPPALFELRYVLILAFHLRLDFSSDLFPSGFRYKVWYAFLIFPCALHDPLISFSYHN
jgi:hypothetical protein